MRISTHFFGCVLVVTLFATVGIFAQTSAPPNTYFQNWSLLNPAAFPRQYLEDQDMGNHFGLVGGYRDYSTEGNATYFRARMEHIPDFNSGNDMKIGLFASFDKVGAWEESRMQFNYAYAFRLSRLDQISIGATLGLLRQFVNIRGTGWSGLPNAQSGWLMDVNMGIFYNSRPTSGGIHRYAKKHRTQTNLSHYYVGISMLQLVGHRLDAQPGNTFDTRLNPQYYAVAGGVFGDFEATVWLRYLPDSEFNGWGFRHDISADFYLRKRIRQAWTGIGVSTNGTANAELGFNFWVGNSVGRIGDQLQFALALGNLSISKQASGGGPNIELSGSYHF